MTDNRHHPHHHPAPKKRKFLQWGMLVAVILMLAAMGMYIMTMDEEFPPDAAPQPIPTPAAVAP